jgi:CRISPR-associated protein Cas2
MRVLVMFDLPVDTAENRKEYRAFRKYLVKNGYLMLQESIYCKLAQNSTAADAMLSNIKKNKPKDGLVQVLRVTEKEYSKMEYVVGKASSEIITDDRRIIIL